MSSVASQLSVTVGNEVGKIDLYHEECPKTVESLLAELPLTCPNLVHARFSGEECSFPVRRPKAPIGRENQKYETEVGDLGYFVESGAICFYYGRMRVISPGNVFGRISENMEGLYRMFKLAWLLPDIPVRIEV